MVHYKDIFFIINKPVFNKNIFYNSFMKTLKIKQTFPSSAANLFHKMKDLLIFSSQDDLAGIGRDCPHKYVGQTSCISGGRIDASCCVDAHFHTACHQTRDITGVVCCKVKGQRPKILARPREKVHVGEGKVFLLSCQAAGSPPPTVHWYKDGRQISDQVNSRISVLSTGKSLEQSHFYFIWLWTSCFDVTFQVHQNKLSLKNLIHWSHLTKL